MKLKRIWLNQVKQFRQPLEIAELLPGINIFVGPNETGKSTVVRAIRAAFFERYKSTSVQELLPWGDSSAAPEVELEFYWQGEHWQLAKRFLKRKRCDLRIGHQHLSGEQAEEKLSELLGFQFAAQGASKPKHWGIPGLLWVEQGGIQEIRHPVDHAGDHLKSALASALSEVVASGGDDLIGQIERERAKLLTATGRETGDYKKIIDACTAHEQDLQALNENIQFYAQKVDRLDILRREQAISEREKPWLAFREQVRQAQSALENVEALQAQLEHDKQALANTEANLVQSRQQFRDFQQTASQLAVRQEQKARTARALEDCRALTAQLHGHLQRANTQYQAAKTAFRAARENRRRENAEREHARLAAKLTELQDKHKKASDFYAQLQHFRSQLQACMLGEQDLVELKNLHEQLATMRIQQQALATRVTYKLAAGKAITLDGETLTGEGERLLLQDTDIDIAGVGELHLQPGGTDIKGVARKRERLEADYAHTLQKLNLTGIAEAEQRQAENHKLAQRIDQLTTRIEMLAPEGVDALCESIRAIEQQLQSLKVEFAVLLKQTSKTVQDNTRTLDENAAEAILNKAEDALKDAEQTSNDHQRELTLRERESENAKREWEMLQAEVMAPERQARESETLERLSLLKAQEAKLRKAIEATAKKIDTANPAILRQDVERLSQSANALENETAQRDIEIFTLQAQLEALGAQGLEETRNEHQQNLARLQRHRSQLESRAAALDLLLGLLKEKRQALTRQLQAPLQKHLNHYLKLLFPQATLAVDEHLRPEILARETELGEVDELSYGAREQMGLISRLAYADLLKEAGRPTLIILDDILVHTDQERLQRMKRVLFDASQRHQVLLFSCHPERWRGLGVGGRDLSQFTSAEARAVR